MNKSNLFTHSIKVYFALFLTVGILFLTLLNWSFYNEAQNIQTIVKQQAHDAATKEIQSSIDNSIQILQNELKLIAQWDEVFQQFHDPSYYFFWHDERLKESGYFKPHYDQLQLYTADKNLLTPASPKVDQTIHAQLPQKIENTGYTLFFDDENELHLNAFEPIYQRGSQEILGYVGVSVDLIPKLFEENPFYYVDKASIQFKDKGVFPYTEMMQHLEFAPISNPVSESLWQLIQNFVFKLVIILFFTVAIFSMIFNKMINTPLQTLSAYLQRLKNNPKESYPAPKNRFLLKEFEELKQSIHDYHRDLQATQTALDKQNLIVWDQARHDALTNIYNRRAFDEAWHEVLMHTIKHPAPISFMLFDCDFFKALNDTYGHEVGDEVIRISATIIQQALPMECPAYRIGGDEFAVIVQNKSKDTVLQIASKCLQALNDYNFSRIGIKERLTFSMGISHSQSNDSNELSNLPRQADIAMYKAKQSHQQKIYFYDLQLEDESYALVSSHIVNKIVDAVHTGKDIQMHYQAIHNLTTHEIYYESLIRIQNENGLIYPNDIFSVINRRRLEIELDTQVIQQILKAFIAGQIPKQTGVSINVSAKTLLQPFFTSLFKPFIPYLAEYKIVLEITENALIDHMGYAQKVLNELRTDGFLIALDDFGSGYSSIRYLAQMPVDIIKFDITMTQALNSDARTQNIIKTTAEMVRRSGYALVMEGIENEAMLEAAKLAGATDVQGYLLHRPSPTFD